MAQNDKITKQEIQKQFDEIQKQLKNEQKNDKKFFKKILDKIKLLWHNN